MCHDLLPGISNERRLKIHGGKDVHSLKLYNMAPENGPSQKESSIPTIHFQVLC